MSVVGIETHQWSGRGGMYLSEEEVTAILSHAQDVGVNFIDTGECYLYHSAERLVGSALRSNRDKFVIATKFGHRMSEGIVVPGWNVSEIEKELEISLKALRTDYIDIYQIHINAPSDKRYFLDQLNAIETLLTKTLVSGKIRSVGVCLGDNILLDPKATLLSKAIEHLPIAVVQTVYNRLDCTAEEKVIPLAQKANLGIVARVPLAKGYLSSRFKPAKNFDEHRLAQVKEIQKSEVPAGIDLAEWSISWCIKNTAVATVVPGCTSPEQLDSSVKAILLI